MSDMSIKLHALLTITLVETSNRYVFSPLGVCGTLLHALLSAGLARSNKAGGLGAHPSEDVWHATNI